ncbi:MAG TPA: DUF2934 domain-containing protein [Bryobacteraceae bacterium]|jgi:hypothetical protein
MTKKPKPIAKMTIAAVEPAHDPLAASDHEKIAALAYLHWQSRGCPVGSPEEDWLAAERELQGTAVVYASK